MLLYRKMPLIAVGSGKNIHQNVVARLCYHNIVVQGYSYSCPTIKQPKLRPMRKFAAFVHDHGRFLHVLRLPSWTL